MEKWTMWKKAKDNTDNTARQRDAVVQTESLDSAADRLITAILGCEEYLAYRAELDKLLQLPDLKAQIDEFRSRNFQLQTSSDIDFDKLDRLEKEYEDIRSNPLVSDFLEAELAFCKRMQGIESRIAEELDFQ